MPDLWHRPDGERGKAVPVATRTPLAIWSPKGITTPKTYYTPWVLIPGIVAGAAYVTGDALGQQFVFPVPSSGIIHAAHLIDQDKEALQVDLILFSAALTTDTADNAAADIPDGDMVTFVGGISITTFFLFNDNAGGQATALSLPYIAINNRLTCKAIARGAQNLTANTDYLARLVILPDVEF